jgi:hypothetical protein
MHKMKRWLPLRIEKMRTRRLLLISSFLLIFTAGPVYLHAQSPETEGLQALAEKISQARAKNLQALKEYSWNQRTETRKDDEIMSTKLELVRYDPSGYEQRTVLDETKPEQKKRIAGRVQKKKMGEMKEWGEEVKSLLMKYTLAEPASLAAFLSKASKGSGQESGQVVLNARNVVQQGDRMAMYIKLADRQIQKTEVFTNHEMDAVFLEITHGQLPDGVNYTKEMNLTISSHGLELTVENFNYNKN